MTKEEYKEALNNLRDLPTKLRGYPLSDGEIEWLAEQVQRVKRGEISIEEVGIYSEEK